MKQNIRRWREHTGEEKWKLQKKEKLRRNRTK
jgi:hypothetical protein